MKNVAIIAPAGNIENTEKLDKTKLFLEKFGIKTNSEKKNKIKKHASMVPISNATNINVRNILCLNNSFKFFIILLLSIFLD